MTSPKAAKILRRTLVGSALAGVSALVLWSTHSSQHGEPLFGGRKEFLPKQPGVGMAQEIGKRLESRFSHQRPVGKRFAAVQAQQVRLGRQQLLDLRKAPHHIFVGRNKADRKTEWLILDARVEKGLGSFREDVVNVMLALRVVIQEIGEAEVLDLVEASPLLRRRAVCEYLAGDHAVADAIFAEKTRPISRAPQQSRIGMTGELG